VELDNNKNIKQNQIVQVLLAQFLWITNYSHEEINHRIKSLIEIADDEV